VLASYSCQSFVTLVSLIAAIVSHAVSHVYATLQLLSCLYCYLTSACNSMIRYYYNNYTQTADVDVEHTYTTQVRPRPARLMVFDKRPGGVGVSQALFNCHPAVLRAAYALLCDCACAKGCPTCIHSFACSNYNGLLDKAAALLILGGLVAGLPIVTDTDVSETVGDSGDTSELTQQQQQQQQQQQEHEKHERQRRHNLAVARSMDAARSSDMMIRNRWVSSQHNYTPAH
jgi:Domain of unknown function (DUF1998)